MLKWTRDFLTGRRARVRFQGHLSEYVTFENGTPQGSILSPYLFNILLEELASLPLAGNTKVFCYADDIAIVSTGPHHLKRAQEAITAVTSRCQSLGLKVNFAKTKATSTATDHSYHSEHIKPTLNGLHATNTSAFGWMGNCAFTNTSLKPETESVLS